MQDRILMAPSVLSADFTALGDAVRMLTDGGADFIHLDVMDGHFVPNLTIGPPVIKAIKAITHVPLDVHLMIDNAEQTVGWYLEAGADLVSVHLEGATHLHRTLSFIRDSGARPAVAINPATPTSLLRDVLGMVDMVLVMSVNPGFGGQGFISRSVVRVAEIAELCRIEGVSPLIQVDGGINAITAPLVTAAGARCLVAGNAVFGQSDPVAAMADIRAAAAVA